MMIDSDVQKIPWLMEPASIFYLVIRMMNRWELVDFVFSTLIFRQTIYSCIELQCDAPQF